MEQYKKRKKNIILYILNRFSPLKNKIRLIKERMKNISVTISVLNLLKWIKLEKVKKIIRESKNEYSLFLAK